MKSAALKLDVEIGVDRTIRLPEGIPVGRAEVIILFEERAVSVSSRPEPSRPESLRPESSRPESPRPPSPRSEPSLRVQPPKLEPIKPEPAKAEAEIAHTIPPPPMTKRSPKLPPPLPVHFPSTKSPLGDRLAATPRPRAK